MELAQASTPSSHFCCSTGRGPAAHWTKAPVCQKWCFYSRGNSETPFVKLSTCQELKAKWPVRKMLLLLLYCAPNTWTTHHNTIQVHNDSKLNHPISDNHDTWASGRTVLLECSGLLYYTQWSCFVSAPLFSNLNNLVDFSDLNSLMGYCRTRSWLLSYP